MQLVKVLYCKLPTNSKQLPAFPLEAVPGTEPWPQRWEARVLPLCHHGPYLIFTYIIYIEQRVKKYTGDMQSGQFYSLLPLFLPLLNINDVLFSYILINKKVPCFSVH